jgi:Fur family ferric uptake transcriptional regulator
MGYISVALRERGHRLTPQRQLIVEAIEAVEGHGHVSAEEIHDRVSATFPQVNISTVYRTLDLLQNLGLVHHMHLVDGVAQYHVASAVRHQHLVCRACGNEQEIAADILDPLAAHIERAYGFQADLEHFAVIGICGECRGGNVSPVHHHH